MPQLGATELAILFAVFLLLFGARKLPELARGTGQALRIFRAETREETPAEVPAQPRAEVPAETGAETEAERRQLAAAPEPVGPPPTG